MGPINERTSGRLTGQLVDETGAGVPASSLTSLLLTLYDKLTGSTINGRSAQNVLNVNNVTVDSSGNLVFLLQPGDNVIVTATADKETHVALFEALWGVGKGAKIEVEFQVRNLSKVS